MAGWKMLFNYIEVLVVDSSESHGTGDTGGESNKCEAAGHPAGIPFSQAFDSLETFVSRSFSSWRGVVAARTLKGKTNQFPTATCTVSHTLPWNWDLYCLWRDTILVKWMFPSKELQLPSCESFTWRIHAALFLGHPKYPNMSLISFCACCWCSGTFLVVAAG